MTAEKLAMPWTGPQIVVEKVSDGVYKCQNLRTSKIISIAAERLKRAFIKEDQDPVAVAAEDNEEYPVEAIIDHDETGKTRSSWSFLVRWKHHGPEYDQWLSFTEVRDLEALDMYLAAHPHIKLPRR